MKIKLKEMMENKNPKLKPTENNQITHPIIIDKETQPPHPHKIKKPKTV